MMYFLGFVCLLSIASAIPIISYDGSQPADGESKISYIILEPTDLFQLGNIPWNSGVDDNSEKPKIFILRGMGNKKFGHLNVLNQQQPSGTSKFSVTDHTETKYLDDSTKINNGANFLDRPCNRYYVNESPPTVSQPEVKVNSVAEYKVESQRQDPSAFVNTEDVKPVESLNIPALSSISTPSTTIQDQKTLVSYKQTNQEYQPEKYVLVKSTPVLNDGGASSDMSSGMSITAPVTSSEMNEHWSSNENSKEGQKEPEVKEESKVSLPETNVDEKTVEESLSSENTVKPTINIPPPPSLDSTITLPSGYSSLLALQSDARVLMEKIKNMKLHNQVSKQSEEKSSNENHQPDKDKVEFVNQKPIVLANASATSVILNKPSVDVSTVANSAEWGIVDQKPKEVLGGNNLEDYPQTFSNVEKESEQNTIKEIKPVVKVNISPSLENTVTLPAGSSLTDVQNKERVILQKVKPMTVHEQEVTDSALENNYHPEVYKLVRNNPIFNGDVYKKDEKVKEPNSLVSLQYDVKTSVDSAIDHKTDQRGLEKNSDKKTSNNNEDQADMDGERPYVHLNIPPPPSIENGITLPSGYSSLEAIQNEEKNILGRIKNVKINQQEPTGSAIVDSPNFEYHPENYRGGILLQKPSVNYEEMRPVVMMNKQVVNNDINQGTDERNAKQPETHDTSENNFSKVNTEDDITDEPASNQEPEKHSILVHIPPPPSIDNTVVLPSGYPSISAIRNEEIILLQKVKGREQKQRTHKIPINIVEEHDEYSPETNKVELRQVVEEQPQPKAVETSRKALFNVPIQPSLGRPSLHQYVTEISGQKTSQDPGRFIVNLSNVKYRPENYKVVFEKKPNVNNEESKPVLTEDISAAISDSRKQVADETNANSQSQRESVLNDMNEKSNSKTNRGEESRKSVSSLKIPPPPSIDRAMVLPSEYPTLPALRNEEIILLQKFKGKQPEEKQPVNLVEESRTYPPQTNSMDQQVDKDQPNINVAETSRTVKYNVPAPPSLDRSIVLPSGYSNIQELEKLIIQKIKEQRRNHSVTASEQKVPGKNFVLIKPGVKTNIPPPPSIDNFSTLSKYSGAKQQVKNVNLPSVRIRGPVIRWNTPAPPTVNKRVVKVSSEYPSLSVLRNEQK